MEEKKETTWKEMFKNPLKKHSTKDIEKAIAECLSSFVGEEIEVSIENIDYNPHKRGMNPGNPVKLNMVASTPIKDFLK